MSQAEKKVTLTVDVQAEIGKYEKSIEKIQTQLNTLSLSGSTKDEFTKIFSNYKTEFNNLKTYLANNQLSTVDEKAVNKSIHNIETAYKQLTVKLQSNGVNTSFLVQDQKAIKKLGESVSNYTQKISGANKQYQDQLKNVSKITTELTRQKTLQELNKVDASNAKAALDLEKEKLETLQKEAELASKAVEAAQAKRDDNAKAYMATKNNPNARYNATINGKKDLEAIQLAQRHVEEYNEKLKEQKNIVDSAEASYNKYNNVVQKADKAIQSQENNLTAANSILKTAKNSLDEIANTSIKEVINELSKATDINWKDFGIDINSIQSFDDLKNALDGLSGNAAQRAHDIIMSLEPAMEDAGKASTNMAHGIQVGTDALADLVDQDKAIQRLQGRLLSFFGIDNAVNLFKRAVRSAFETVKDLDAVMTETAVVTDFKVSDMWNQLGDYTKRANELGVTIHDAYEAATLYYQQGLSTNEVMAVSNETLKMARIAGLDAADATDRMTNALRGFNMEITNANAQNINDVYSNLAARTASNVDEISTAMTKVASLANNANMSFENTAALLSQIIETTRESAETAGTALKTVVARFSEVKSAVSKGELMATGEDGEEIDVNKVSQALRIAGIDMNEYFTGVKGLDEIFIELASRWDSLDTVQQRYIATTAAGSRQQSRFIAMMQDYDRTMELVNIANNSAGASQEQFNKTLDSLQSKLNELKNSWDTFIMNLLNNDVVKFFVDAANGVLTFFNNLTSGMSGAGKSLTNIGLLFGGLAIGKNVLKSVFSGTGNTIVKLLGGEVKEAGKSNALKGIFKGFWNNFSANLKNTFSPTKFDDSFKNIKTLLPGGAIKLNWDDIILAEGGPEAFIDTLANQVGGNVQNFKKKLQAQFKSIGTIDLDIIKVGRGGITQEQADAAKNYVDQMHRAPQTLDTVTRSMTALGGALAGSGLLLGKFADILNETGHTKAATVVRDIASAVGILGGVLMAIPPILTTIAASNTLVQDSIPFIGQMLVLATAVIAAGKILSDIIEDDNERLKRLEETLEKTTEAAKEARNYVKGLDDAIASISEQQDAITKLIPGTEAYNQKVKETTNSIKELVSQYPELSKYLDFSNGQITFDTEGAREVLQNAQQRELNLQLAQWAQERQLSAADNNANPFAGNSVTNSKMLTDTGIDVISRLLAGPGNKDFSEYAKETNNIISAAQNYLKDTISAQDDITKILDKREQVEQDYIKNLKIAAAETLGYAGNVKDIQLAANDFSNALDEIDGKIGDSQEYRDWLNTTYGEGNWEITNNKTGAYKYKQAGQTEYTSIEGDVALAQYQSASDYNTVSEAIATQTATRFEAVFGTQGKEADTGVKSSLIKLYDDLFIAVGKDNATELAQGIFDIITDTQLSPDQQRNLAKQLTNIDWGADNSLNQFNDILKATDISALEADSELGQLITELQSLAKVTSDVNLDALREAIAGGQELRAKAAKGTIDGFTKEEFESATALGLDPARFIKNFDGTYIFDGVAEELVNLLDTASQTYLNNAAESLTQKVNQGQALQGLINELGSATGVSNENILTLGADELSKRLFGDEYLSDIIGVLGDAGFSIQGNLNAEELAQFIQSAFLQLIGDNGTILAANQSAQSELAGQFDIMNRQRFENQVSDSGQKMEDVQALADHYKYLAQAQYDAAVTAGQESEEYAQHALKLAENEDLLKQLALANLNLNTGVGNLVDTYEDWNAVLEAAKLDKNVKLTSEYGQTINELKTNVKQMLNIQGDLSDAFIESADTAALLQRIATNDMDAIDELRQAAAQDIRLNWQLEDDINEKLVELENKLIDFANNYDDLEISANFDDTEAIAAMNELLATGQVTIAQMQDYFNSLSYTPVVEHNYEKQSIRHTGTIPHVVQNDDGSFGVVPVEYDYTTEEMVDVPSIKSLEYNGPSGPRINTSISSKAANNTPKSTSKSSGSSAKQKTWKNPYDELYNLQEKINESLRDREKLEREYNRLLDKRTTSAYEVRKNQLDEIANLKREIDLQNQFLEGRRKQLANLGNEKHEDANGNLRSFNSWGVTKYASYNELTGLITIDWAAIDKVRDEQLGGAIEAYINRLEDISKDMEDAQDTMENMEDIIKEIRDRGKEEYLELEQRLYDALVAEQQKVIDEYSSIADQIDAFNSRVIDNIRESIDLERQIRDNTKTEEDISNKEARLAYLRRDTSGANQLEIMQLEKELENARESYQDTLIDQALDKIGEANDKAAEQRQTQIDLMQAQLDYAAENGAYWDQVYGLIATSINPDGTLKNNSQLVELLQNTEAFKGMSFFGQQNWINEMVHDWLQAEEGLGSWIDDWIRNASNLTLADNTAISKQNGVWTDAQGNIYSDLSWDAQTGGVVGTKTAPTAANDEPELDLAQVKEKVAAALWSGDYGWGVGDERRQKLNEIFGANNGIQALVNSGVGFKDKDADLSAYSYQALKQKYKAYKNGGLSTETGLAWLDGTRTKPELILNAEDTSLFLQIRDLLRGRDFGNSNLTSGGDNYFDIDISGIELSNDYDVDQLAARIREQIVNDAMYRNVNAINFIR